MHGCVCASQRGAEELEGRPMGTCSSMVRTGTVDVHLNMAYAYAAPMISADFELL